MKAAADQGEAQGIRIGDEHGASLGKHRERAESGRTTAGRESGGTWARLENQETRRTKTGRAKRQRWTQAQKPGEWAGQAGAQRCPCSSQLREDA